MLFPCSGYAATLHLSLLEDKDASPVTLSTYLADAFYLPVTWPCPQSVDAVPVFRSHAIHGLQMNVHGHSMVTYCLPNVTRSPPSCTLS